MESCLSNGILPFELKFQIKITLRSQVRLTQCNISEDSMTSDMEQMMAQMLKQLGKEQGAEDDGCPPPDMPDMTKLISSVTKTMMENDEIKSMMKPQRNRLVDSKKPRTIVHNLPVSLAELFTGASRTIKMRRQLYNATSDRNEWESTSVECVITRGMRSGDRVLIRGVGDAAKGQEAGDLEVVLNLKKDGVFDCVGDSGLSLDIEIPMAEMFTYSADIEHLDGELYPVFYNSDTRPVYGRMRVTGLGLPCADGSFGDLWINTRPAMPSRNEFAQISLVPSTDPQPGDHILVHDTSVVKK